MATSPPQINLDRISLTELHLRTLEVALYQMADAINRLKKAGAVYTKGERRAIQLKPPQGGVR